MYLPTDFFPFFAAKNNSDLMFLDRKICEEDSDYKQMSGLYTEIRSYLSKKDRKKKKHKKQYQSGGISEIFEDE